MQVNRFGFPTNHHMPDAAPLNSTVSTTASAEQVGSLSAEGLAAMILAVSPTIGPMDVTRLTAAFSPAPSAVAPIALPTASPVGRQLAMRASYTVAGAGAGAGAFAPMFSQPDGQVIDARLLLPRNQTFADPNQQDKFKTVLCRYYARGGCKDGKSCSFAHGKGELRGRAQKKIMKECYWWLHYKQCNYGDSCKYLH